MGRSKIKSEKQYLGLKPFPWLASALFILGLSVIAGFYWDQKVTVQKITYEGLYFVEVSELDNTLKTTKGLHPDSINYSKLSKSIEDIPYVERADLHIEPGGVLKVGIRERKPVALLADGDEKIYLDKEGIKLEIKDGKVLDLPILYGFKAQPLTDTLQSVEWNSTSRFLTELQKDPLYNATISEVAWAGEEGIVALTHENGVKLIFGRDNYKNELRNWKAFYSSIIREKSIERMKSIDLRFEGQIITRENSFSVINKVKTSSKTR